MLFHDSFFKKKNGDVFFQKLRLMYAYTFQLNWECCNTYFQLWCDNVCALARGIIQLIQYFFNSSVARLCLAT